MTVPTDMTHGRMSHQLVIADGRSSYYVLLTFSTLTADPTKYAVRIGLAAKLVFLALISIVLAVYGQYIGHSDEHP